MLTLVTNKIKYNNQMSELLVPKKRLNLQSWKKNQDNKNLIWPFIFVHLPKTQPIHCAYLYTHKCRYALLMIS